MTLGQQITVLRKKKKLSQGEMGKLVETSGDIIGRYERDEVKPSIEVVIRMADALQVSLDFLVGKTDLELDSATLNRMREVEKLPEQEKQQVLLVLDALIRDFKARRTYAG
ncbi:helix-turn-helix domain-containing protein [Pedobacter sp. L105]|uniref:helix-turn-helix domain-containing protein n=1 Tax=Pedobacter sp. L105 TaxID=1641871 RepID=UPI00131C37A4|nr:helix-turn-helix transcriptional regulator [Pedobacter sp. L105]